MSKTKYIQLKLTKKQCDTVQECLKQSLGASTSWNNLVFIDDIQDVINEMKHQRKGEYNK